MFFKIFYFSVKCIGGSSLCTYYPETLWNIPFPLASAALFHVELIFNTYTLYISIRHIHNTYL